MDKLVNINQLKFIVDLGREEETVDILGTTFTFKTLTVDENTQSFEAPTKQAYMDDVAKFNAMRIEILSRAIVKINNIFIPDNMKAKVKDLLKGCQQAALNKLFTSYQALVDRQEESMKVAEGSVDSQLPPTHSGTQPQATLASAPPPPATAAPTPPAPAPVPQPSPVVEERIPSAPPMEAQDGAVDIVNPSNLLGQK